MENNVKVNGGIGFGGLLQITFIVLKLVGVINWSWFLVLLPSIILSGIAVLVLISSLILSII